MASATPSLVDLPETVVRNLLPYLHPTDLLRLRHVHPVTRAWAANMSNSSIVSAIWQKSKGHFLEIDGGKYSIHHLLAMSTPNPLHYSSRFFIQNFYWDLFSDPDFDKFLEVCGPRIRHLHIQQYNLCRDPKELRFYNSLVNLTRLDIDVVEMENMTPEHLTNVADYIPTATFGILLKLGIGRISYGMEAEDHLDQRRYIRNHFFPAFTSLQMLKSPKEDFEAKDMEYITSAPECFTLPFVKIFPFHLADGNYNGENGPSLTTLKLLDMQSLQEPYLDSFKFIALGVAAIKCGVELRNLRANCHTVPEFDIDEFLGRMGLPEPDLAVMPPQSRTIQNVTSILNIVPSFVYYICPNIKQVSIATCQWCMHNLPDPRIPMIQIQWPRVETIQLNINSRMMGGGFSGEGRRGTDKTECFLEYLFAEPNRRTTLKSLKLSFLQLQEEMPLPTLTPNIGSSCPNLVKLELIGWKGGNESYWPLWHSLTQLEEIIIGKCEKLGNRGFIGPVLRENVKPLFLNLTELKILVLKGMDTMPGITDLTFQRVISNLSLTHFEMTSGTPIRNVTIKGISSLLGGPFAKSIQHFPFFKWTLAIREFSNENRETILDLYGKFRSTHIQTLCDPLEHVPGLFCKNCAILSSLAEHHTFNRPSKMESTLFRKRRVDIDDGNDEEDDGPKEGEGNICEMGEDVIRCLCPKWARMTCLYLFVAGLLVGVLICLFHWTGLAANLSQ